MAGVVLLNEEHVDGAAKILSDEWYDSVLDAREQLEEKIKSGEGFVAVDGGEVVGVLLYARDYSHYANNCEDLAVSKDHRKKGIGLELLRKFIETSREEQHKKQKYCLSSTDVTNEASIKLHAKAGFEQLGVVKKLHFGTDEIFFGFKLDR